LTTAQESSPGPIPLVNLIELDSIGFKLIPLIKDRKTPALPTNPIYNNPSYWTPGRLQQEHWRFCNVATTFGEISTTDENGAKLYLHELDEDSAEVYKLLAPKHEEIKANTYVIQTRKVFEVNGEKVNALRFAWLSRTQHPSIPHHRSKPNFEFEIKSDNTCGHSTLPPSKHRDDINFEYTAVGQNRLTISDDLYDEVVTVLSDCIIQEQAKEAGEPKFKRNPIERIIEMDKTQIETLVSIVKPYYIEHIRHDLCYALDGILRKSYVIEVCALQVITTLAADDEELDSRIRNLEDTYTKDPLVVTGRKYLKDILSRAINLSEESKAEKDRLDIKEREELVKSLLDGILVAIGVQPGYLGWIVETVMNQHRFATLKDTDEILHWNNGNYIPDGESVIKQEIFKHFGYDAQIRHKREVLDFIRTQTYADREDFDTDLDIVNIGDGLYHVSTDTVTEHDPNYLTMIQNPGIKFSLKASPEHYRKCAEDIFYAVDVQAAIDSQAYTFHRANPFDMITVLLGDGLNGKTAFMSPLRAAHTKKHFSTVRFSKLINPEDRFSLAQLEGKAFNYDGEMSKGFIEDPATIKLITGNDEVNIEEKNQMGRSVRLYTKLFNSANSLPESGDQSGGYYRRHNVLCLPRIFEEGADGTDPDMATKLSTPEEISGIFFYEWMPALRKILKEKKVAKNERTIEELRDRYEKASNPVFAFKNECLMDGSGSDCTMTKEDLYQTFLVFCGKNRLQIISKEKFGREFKKLMGVFADYRSEWRCVRLIPKKGEV
jgi:P4 family phage/plasmid primase-like protien